MTRKFIYALLDADGVPLYVGQTRDIVQRLKGHDSNCRMAPAGPFRTWRESWFYRTRSVALAGPYEYRTALRLERRLIERLRPVGNVQFNPDAGAVA